MASSLGQVVTVLVCIHEIGKTPPLCRSHAVRRVCNMLLPINTKSPSPCAAQPLLDVALLLVGDSQPVAFQMHVQALLDNVVGPLSPDVYAVTDAGGSTDLQNITVARALPMLLGARLHALGLLYGVSEELLAELRANHPSTVFSAVPPPNASLHGVRQPTHGKGIFQWYRLRECWRLLEEGERRRKRSRQYELVFRLRFDWTPLDPWWPCLPDISLATTTPWAMHLAADHAFWGPRNTLAIAADTWDAFLTHFLGSAGVCANPMHRPLHVGAMLDSLRGMPVWGTSKATWFFYIKIMTLPWLTVGNESVTKKRFGDRSTSQQWDTEHDWEYEWGTQPNATRLTDYHQAAPVIDSLRAVQRAGWDYIGTDDPEGLRRHRGVLALHSDYRSGTFASEMSFLVWMIANNITLCDVGAGTTRVLWKGRSKGRASNSCPSPSPRPPARLVQDGMLAGPGGTAQVCRLTSVTTSA